MMMMAYQESMENLSNGNPVNNYRDSTQVNKKNTLTKRNRLKKEKPIRFGFVYDLFPPLSPTLRALIATSEQSITCSRFRTINTCFVRNRFRLIERNTQGFCTHRWCQFIRRLTFDRGTKRRQFRKKNINFDRYTTKQTNKQAITTNHELRS